MGGQIDDDAAAGAGRRIGDVDVAVVEIDDPSDDGEPEARPGAAARRIHAVESVEDQVALLDRNTGSAVLDLEPHVVALEVSAERDGCVGR